MIPKKTFLAAGMAAVLSFGAPSLATAHGSGSNWGNPYYGCPYGGHMGPGMMGQGQMGPGYGMGPGMMGQGQMGPGYGMGPGMMGQGQMGPGYGMGPGMMGQGQMGPMMGQGQMGPGMMRPLPEDLSTAQVRHMMEHQLAWQGNPNLKVGKVEDKDDDTIIADVVTQDGSLVQRLEVDRHTGWMRPAQ